MTRQRQAFIMMRTTRRFLLVLLPCAASWLFLVRDASAIDQPPIGILGNRGDRTDVPMASPDQLERRDYEP